MNKIEVSLCNFICTIVKNVLTFQQIVNKIKMVYIDYYSREVKNGIKK